jgi:hypothetical protein
VVKHVDAVEVRVVAAAVLAATTDAVLVAHHLPKPGAHLVSTARPVKEIAWEQEARKRKKAGGGGGDAVAAGDKQLGSCAAGTRTRTNTNPNGTEANASGRNVRACVAGYIYLYKIKLLLAAMYHRRV